MKVLIGIPTAGYSRNDSFYDYYNLLEKPEGTICTFARGQSPARNRNLMIKQALKHDCTHILFIDDDLAVPSDLLLRLMKHDKDVVTGLYLMRSFPHQPIIFDHFVKEEHIKFQWKFPVDGENGLVPIVNCGLGCALIKTDVFRALEEPWITLGEIEKDHWCDDTAFFPKVTKAGFEIFCDLSIQCGHMAQVIVRPEYVDGKWFVSYDTNGTSKITFPLPIPEPELIGVK